MDADQCSPLLEGSAVAAGVEHIDFAVDNLSAVVASVERSRLLEESGTLLSAVQ